MINADTRAREAVRYLLTVRIGGERWRVTTGPPVEIELADGSGPYTYSPGLSVTDPGNVATFVAGPLSPRSATVELGLAQRNVAAEVAAGLPLRSATAELAAWRPGTAWEDREVLLDGAVSAPTYGGAGEPVAFALVEDPALDSSAMLEESARVGASTFPRSAKSYNSTPAGCDPDVEGAYYPIVIGRPGGGVPLRVLGMTVETVVPAWPLSYVERTADTTTGDHRFLLAGHPLDATECTLFNRTDGDVERSTFLEVADDDLGQRVTLLEPPASGTIPSTASPQLYGGFDWTRSAQSGGMPDPFGPGPLRRADHLIRWALGNSGIRYDRRQIGRLSAVRAYLFDGMVNAQAGYWEWLQAVVLPLLPLITVQGPGGVYLAHLDPDVPSALCLADLEVGRNVARASRIMAGDPGGVVNRVTVAFAPNVHTGTMTQARTVAGVLSPADTASGEVVPDARCRASHELFGLRPVRVEAPLVYDQATALALARAYARSRAIPPSSLVVHARRGLDWLRPGDPVRLTDEALGISGLPVHVQAVRRTGGALELGLAWWPSPSVGP